VDATCQSRTSIGQNCTVSGGRNVHICGFNTIKKYFMIKAMQILVFIVFLFIAGGTNAQVEIKTEYIGSSRYTNGDNIKTKGRGSAKVFSFDARIPISVEVNEAHQPVKFWAVSIGASYTSFSNKAMDADFGPDRIADANLTLLHLWPISQRWSMLAMAGAGVYSGHTELSKIGFKNVMGNGGVLFIWHLRKNLDVGLGPVVNTLLGYPMIFPGVYANWRTLGDYELKVSMVNSLQVSAGKRYNDYFKLNLIASFDGSMALENEGKKKLMFTHQYFTTGIQPEFSISKTWSISATAGLAAGRSAYYQERTLKSIFRSDDNIHNPHFGAAPYFSISVKAGL